MARPIQELNAAQRQAVQTTEGPVLILAGAGSGKTRTLTARLHYLIEKKGIPPKQLLAVTFTNKAAGEMAARLGRKLPWLGTFHRLAGQILRRELDQSTLPFTSRFTIYDKSDQLTLIKQILRHRGIDPKQFNPLGLKSLIEGAKNELLTPEQYARYVEGPFQEMAASVYREYQARLVAANALDFDDLINRLLELFAAHPKTLRHYQQLFRYILVDEYQDTNKGQYQLIQLLAAGHGNLFVVGDDWQAIYAFRGADFRNILRFTQNYPKAVVIKLEENYRSTQNILDAAHAIISQNRQRSEKRLFTTGNPGEPVTVVHCLNDLSESEFVITESLALLRRGQATSLDELAVLYRTNAQSRSLEESLIKVGMPYRIVGALKFYDRKEVKDVLAYLKLLANPNDAVSLERIINVPPRKIGQKTLADWRANSDEPPPRVAAFLLQIERWRQQLADCSPDESCDFVIAESGLAALYADGTVEGESRLENLRELVAAAAGHATLDEFLEQVALVQETDSVRQGGSSNRGAGDRGALNLMTLHAVKGLEFDTVFMVGMEEGLMPHSRALLEPADMEEERRLCYVGMTRPRRRLYLLHADERRRFGQVAAGQPSRFLAAIPKRLLKEVRW